MIDGLIDNERRTGQWIDYIDLPNALHNFMSLTMLSTFTQSPFGESEVILFYAFIEYICRNKFQ